MMFFIINLYRTVEAGATLKVGSMAWCMIFGSKCYVAEIFSLTLRLQAASQSPVVGNVGGSADISEKRLLDALSWQTEIWKILIFVKNEANSGCLVDMYISSDSARERRVWAYSIFPREALQVCSFDEDGHSRASVCGTSKQYGSHAFSL